MSKAKDSISPLNIKFNASSIAKDYKTASFILDPPSIAASSVGSASVFLPGIFRGDMIDIDRPSLLPSGLVMAGEAITSSGILTLYFGNITPAAINASSLVFTYHWIDFT